MDGGAASRDDYDDDEGGRGRRYRMGWLMFGNVDVEGDLDADYLDEDAKEHLAAIVDKLGSSNTDIDLINPSPMRTDTSEQDYDKKAEDGIDYEDFDEQYDGPETEATREDRLSTNDRIGSEYFSSDPILSPVNHRASVLDEDNYDEDEDTIKEDEVTENNFKKQPDIVQDLTDSKMETSLPVLCIEDGLVILRFSEIFGFHEPLKKKVDRKAHHRYSKIEGFQGKETC